MTSSGPSGTDHDVVADAHEDLPPRESEGVGPLLLFLVAAVLMALAPFATRPAPVGKGWYLAPVVWPLLSLSLTMLAGSVLAWRFIANYRQAADRRTFLRRAARAFDGMGRALEYSLYFCLYILAISYVGFALATLVFLQFVFWRSGLRGPRSVLTALLLAIGIVVIFRIGIGLWFPLAPVFGLLPEWVGNMLGSVL